MEKQTKRSPAADTRERLLDAAASLLSHGGREAVSTRAVSAAGVQAPTIYRLFGDMNGLLDAVATHGFRTYLADKHSLGEPTTRWTTCAAAGICTSSSACRCPLLRPDVRRGARTGLAGGPGGLSDAASADRPGGGRRRSAHERGPGDPDHARQRCRCGPVTARHSPADRDAGISPIVREQVLRTITTGHEDESAAPTDVPSRSVALHEALREQRYRGVTPAEQGVLAEWLDRMADADSVGRSRAGGRP